MSVESATREGRALAAAPRGPASLAAALHETAWSPAGDLANDDWLRQGRWLGALGRGAGWWIGDWVRYGNLRYGERYALASRITGYDRQSLMNMAYVASRFRASRRREKLSFSHHAELAAFPEPIQERWLDSAESGHLSVRSLRAGVRRETRSELQLARLAGANHRRGATAGEEDSEAVCPCCGHHFEVARHFC